MGWDSWDDDRWYPPSRPIRVKGGIRAQSKRGAFAERWWAQRWIAVLESFDIGARLGRGRSYARGGQVVSIDIEKGLVRAKVQGSRRQPYDVTVKLRPLRPAEWRRLAGRLSAQALFAARLLAGEMPPEIEQVFAAEGLSLFPEKSRELATACSCPDWSNPCKHVAAVYYLIGEEFDRDPFLLFRLRGLDRQDLMGLLQQREAAVPARPGRKRKGAEGPREDAPPEQEPGRSLSPEARRFWGEERRAAMDLGALDTPPVTAALVRRLGRFPFWRGEASVLEALEPAYREAARRAIDLAVTAASPAGGSETAES